MARFTKTDLRDAISALGMLKYFPSDVGTRAAIGTLLAKMVPGKTELDWLVDTLIRFNEWPGPGEVRGLLCTRFRPADGIEADCSLPGYRAVDFEARHYEEHTQLKADGYSAEALELLKAAEPKLLRMPPKKETVQ